MSNKRGRDEYNAEVHAAVGTLKRHSPTNDDFEARSEQMRLQFERQLALRLELQQKLELRLERERQQREAQERQLEFERQQVQQAQANEKLAEVTNERLIRELQKVQQRLNECEDDNRRMVNRIAELQRQQAAELGAAREAQAMAEKQLEQAMRMLHHHSIMPSSHLNMLYKTDIKF